MDFDTFLTSAITAPFWRQHTTYCFVGAQYPLLWFSKLFDMVAQKNLIPYPYQRIFVDSIEKKSLDATLSQSILGNYSFFWLGNVSGERENKNTQELVQTLCTYKGPHSIALFTTKSPKDISSSGVVIMLPSELQAQQVIRICDIFFTAPDAPQKSLVKKLLNDRVVLDLETCSMLINYVELADTQQTASYGNFLSSIIGSNPSLNQLSEQFFAKNAKAFFTLWHKVRDTYPEVFWIIFWAEQMWKSYHVIGYLEDKNFVQAKRIGFRLPYSFMNRDWQKSTTKELAGAYQFLYHMDYALKTGSTFNALDLFYMNYFSGSFA
jgi:hypothetical protein